MNNESQDMLKILQNLENATNNKSAPVVDASGNSVPTNILALLQMMRFHLLMLQIHHQILLQVIL